MSGREAESQSSLQLTPPLQPEDCACAVSMLWWCQHVAGDEKLWDVVDEASKSIKALKSQKSGLAFWNIVDKEEWTPPYTVSIALRFHFDCVIMSDWRQQTYSTP